MEKSKKQHYLEGKQQIQTLFQTITGKPLSEIEKLLKSMRENDTTIENNAQILNDFHVKIIFCF